MRNRPDTDLHYICERHRELEERLQNWRRWCADNGARLGCSPMFRQYRSKWRQWHEPEIVTPVDQIDAALIERTLRKLPERNRLLLRWWYVGTIRGVRHQLFQARRVFGVTDAGLVELLDTSRDMLQNRLHIQKQQV